MRAARITSRNLFLFFAGICFFHTTFHENIKRCLCVNLIIRSSVLEERFDGEEGNDSLESSSWLAEKSSHRSDFSLPSPVPLLRTSPTNHLFCYTTCSRWYFSSSSSNYFNGYSSTSRLMTFGFHSHGNMHRQPSINRSNTSSR